MGLGKSLKKVGHKISHGVKKLGKSTSFKRGIGGAVIGGLLAGPAGAVVGGVATGAISNIHNKHKASKKKNKNSIFEGSCNKSTGCCGSKKTSGCSSTQPVSQCSSTVQQPAECYPQMDSNMFMNFINNIFEKLISLIEKLSGQQTVNNNYNNYNYNNFNHNDYNTYNSYTTNNNTVNDIDNILNNNISVFNNKIDNDIYNYNVLGNNNQIVTYDA